MLSNNMPTYRIMCDGNVVEEAITSTRKDSVLWYWQCKCPHMVFYLEVAAPMKVVA